MTSQQRPPPSFLEFLQGLGLTPSSGFNRGFRQEVGAAGRRLYDLFTPGRGPSQQEVDALLQSWGLAPEQVRSQPETQFRVPLSASTRALPELGHHFKRGETRGRGQDFLKAAERVALQGKSKPVSPPPSLGETIGRTAGAFVTGGMGQEPFTLEEAGSPLMTAFAATPPGHMLAPMAGPTFRQFVQQSQQAARAAPLQVQRTVTAVKPVAKRLATSEAGRVGKAGGKEPWQIKADEVKARDLAVREAEGSLPWQMRQEQYVAGKARGGTPEFFRYGKNNEWWTHSSKTGEAYAEPEEAARRAVRHKISVRQALSEGKPVPAEVLAEYPDLVTGAGKAAEALPDTGIGKRLHEVPVGTLSKAVEDVPWKVAVTKNEINIVAKSDGSRVGRYGWALVQQTGREWHTQVYDDAGRTLQKVAQTNTRHKAIAAGREWAQRQIDRAFGVAPQQVTRPPLTEGVSPPQAIGQVQAGMGIGEKAPQGQLLGEFQGKPVGQVPLIDKEAELAKQARRARATPPGPGLSPPAAPQGVLGVPTPKQAAWLKTAPGQRFIELSDIGVYGRNPKEAADHGRLRQRYIEAEMTPSERVAWRKEMKEAKALDDAAEREAVAEERAAAREEAETELQEPQLQGTEIGREARLRQEVEAGATADLPPAREALPAGPPAVPPEKPPVALGAGGGGMTPEEGAAAIKKLTTFIHSPASLNLSEFTLELRRKQLQQRVALLQKRTDELLLGGAKFEDAMQQAQHEAMGGTFDRPGAILPEVIAQQFRDAAFAQLWLVLKDEPLERLSTMEALTNALLGKGIPRLPGTTGRSAYTRLSRVFPPEVMKILEKNKPIADTFEQALLKTGQPQPMGPPYVPPLPELRGEQLSIGLPPKTPNAPTPLNLGAAEAVRRRQLLEGHLIGQEPKAAGLAGSPMGFPEAAALTGEQQLALGLPSTQAPLREGPILAPARFDVMTEEGLRRGFPGGKWPAREPLASPRYEPPIDKAVKMPSMMPMEHQHTLIKALKEAGWTVIDIGNFLRANKASFDFSFWRQQAPFILNHKKDFLAANAEGWKALRSKAFAKASEDRIKASPNYRLYEEAGYDFLRPLEQKGVPAWRREERFMVMGSERPIPKFTEKLPWVRWSQRSFVTAINEMNWRMFNGYVDKLSKMNAEIAAGKITLREGEAFSIPKHLDVYAAMLSDMTGRAKLGPLKELSPALNAGFFSIRYTLGRLLTPRHLLSADPMVRKEAWMNILTFIGEIAAVEVIGEKLGLWDIEKDPRSADFMKLRIGPVRYDPWGGYQQFVTMLSRVTTGKYKSSVSGFTRDTTVPQTLSRFAQSRESPLASLIMEGVTQETYLGEEVDPRNLKQWADRLAPMAPQDMSDAAEELGGPGAFAGLPSLVGIGVQSYHEPIRAWAAAHGLKDTQTYFDIPTDPVERKAKRINITPERYRERYPDVDAQLFVGGRVTSLKTSHAVDFAYRIITDMDLDVGQIRGVKERQEKAEKRQQWGLPPERDDTKVGELMRRLSRNKGKTPARQRNLQRPVPSGTR